MEFKLDQLSINNYTEFIKYLKNAGDNKYKNFIISLTPNIDYIYGIKLPILKKIAKDISKTQSIKETKYLLLNGKTHEEKLLYAILLGNIKYDNYTEFIQDVQAFIPKINNWSVNDTFATYIKKHIKNYNHYFFEHLKNNIISDNPWQTRFYLVCLIFNFVDDEHIDHIVNIVKSIKSDHYYINMGIAWLICECYIKQKEKTLQLLKTQVLGKWVNNKSIQKIIESNRVCKIDKQSIKQYKIKNAN